MKKIIIALILPLFILSCSDSSKIDPCLEALEIISTNEFPDGTIEYEVIGEVSAFSKGAYEFEQALERTLDLPKRTMNGCLVFEENFPECFGYYVFDLREKVKTDHIQLYQKAKVTLRRIELDEIIPLTARKQKNVQYLYLIREIEQPILNGE